MSETANIVEINGAVEVEEEVVEKQGLFKSVGTAIKGKYENFKEDHPKGCKFVKRTCKVLGTIAFGVACVFVGAGMASKDPGDYPGFDDSNVGDSGVVEE